MTRSLAILLAALAMPAAAQPASPSTQAFKSANETMMHGMDAPLTGDPDQDFVGTMLPHHQGAVAMARIELQYGRDPALRRLARGIIAAQQREIAEMTAWRRHHPAPG